MTREASSELRILPGPCFCNAGLAFLPACLGRDATCLLHCGYFCSLAVLQRGARASACVLHAGSQLAQTGAWRGFWFVRELREFLRAGLSTRVRNSLRCR